VGVGQSLIQPNQAFAQGNFFYIAKNGNDSNPGTLALPFLTIQKCAELATSGDICYIRAGVYRETVKPLNSGVTFSSYNSEIATISGTEVIPNATFSQHSGNIYKAPLGWSLNIRQPFTQSTNNQVFVDSNMQVEARWPNIPVANVTKITNISGTTQDNARADSAQIASSTSASYTDSDLTTAGSFWGQGVNKGKINFAPGFGINQTTCDITTKTTTGVSFGCNPDPGQGGAATTLETDSGTMTAPKGNNYYYLWGKLEALDSAGEFFVDPPDNDSGQVISQNGNYFSQGNYNLYLQMPDNSNPISSGKVIEVRKRMYGFDLRNINSTTIQGINLFAATINTDNATNGSTFDNLDIRYPWHTQELPTLGYWNGTVALPIRGSNNTLKNSYLAYASGTMLSFAPSYQQTNSGNLAQNNVIQNFGYGGIGTGYNGSSGDPARKHQFVQNTIFNAGRFPIQAESAVDITYNDVYNSHLQITDLGAIYGWGTDGKGSNIAYNLVHDVHAELNIDDLQFGGHGIYLDDETTDFNIYRNIVWQTTSPGLMFAGYRPWEQDYNPGKTNTHRLAYNNTIDGQLNFLNKCNGNVCGFQTGTEIKNNIFTGQTAAPTLDQAYGSVVLANNLFGNAQFNNAQNLDYGLQSTSPAVDAGQVIAPYTDNAVGLPDQGALERGTNRVVSGAVARTTDLVNVSLNCQKNTTTATCTVGNLPLGRKIPTDFKIQIGNALSTPSCLNQTNYTTNLTTTTCSNIDLNSQTGLQPLAIQIGNGSQVSKGDFDLGAVIITGPTVVLNEINYGGSTNSSTDQWLELYNNSSQAVDLTGYQVQGLGNTTSPNITLNSSLCTNLNLPAGGYFLIAKYPKTNSQTNLNIDPDCIAPDLELGTSEKLRLYNTQAVLIDESL